MTAFGALAMAAILCAPGTAAAVTMRAGFQRDRIYLGTAGVLVVTVADQARLQWPEVSEVAGLKIERYGQPERVMALFRGSARRSYRFLVTPSKTGKYTIPTVSMAADDRTLIDGPLTLTVIEAPLKFLDATLESPTITRGKTTTLTLTYQGFRPNTGPTVPQVPGLAIRSAGPPRRDIDRQTGVPITRHTYRITAQRVGTYPLKGISFDGVPADTVTLTVAEFVVTETRTGETSLIVGEQTQIRLLVRGLKPTQGATLAVTGKLRIGEPKVRKYRDQLILDFDITAIEPGTPKITALKLEDGRRSPLPEPVLLSVRQAGEAGILSCKGLPRSEETVLGEPFLVDYEVTCRGELRQLAVDPSQATWANKPYIKVTPVNNVSYAGWEGTPLRVGYGDKTPITVLSGTGEFNGQPEQRLRFTLKITPLVAGELSLDGLKVLVAIQVTQRGSSGRSRFFSSRTQTFSKEAQTPSHRVVDPPGQNAPPGFAGAVGTFTFETQLDRTTAAEMSPLTLTMKITGETVSSEFQPPSLTEVDALTRHFDVSPTVSGGEVEGNTITFSQTLRPRSETITELPALPLVTYDYRQRKYDTIYSLPVPLTITPGSRVDAGDMVAVAEPQPLVSGIAPQPDGTDAGVRLGANYTTLGEVAAAPVLGVGTMVGLMACGPVLIVLVFSIRHWRERYGPSARIRQERHVIIRSLKHLAENDHYCAALSEAVQAYLRLKFDLPPGEMSRVLIRNAFAQHHVDAALLKETEDLLDRCDVGRFATGGTDANERAQWIERTRNLLTRLERFR